MYCLENPSLVHVITAARTMEVFGSALLAMVQHKLKGEVCRGNIKLAKTLALMSSSGTSMNE